MTALLATVAQAQSPLEALRDRREDETTRTFRLLGRNTIWTQVASVPVDFPTFHSESVLDCHQRGVGFMLCGDLVVH